MKLLLFSLLTVLSSSYANATLDPRVMVSGTIVNLDSTRVELQAPNGQRFFIPRPKTGNLSALRPGKRIAMRLDLARLNEFNKRR